jgi:hypothetical protein
VHGARHAGDAVFGKHEDASAALLHVGDELAGDGVDFVKVLADVRMVGAEPLEVVIEVGQVDERQGGPVLVEDVAGAGGDPLRRDDIRLRAPEVEQGELPELGIELRRSRPSCTCCTTRRAWRR